MTGPAGRVAICTALTKNFASFARVLARSLRAVHPDIPVFAAVAERAEALDGWRESDFALLPLETLGVPDLPRQAFLNPPHELTVLTKPLVLSHVLGLGFDTVVFLDSDILVLDDLGPVLSTSAAHAITLAPHLLSPPEDDAAVRELGIVRAGTFNGGFIAVSARPEARRFLEWWTARILTWNRLEPRSGLHHDQRWLDLVPAFFEDVAIVRDPGCNVAYWNLPERRLQLDGDRVTVTGGPCRFFHFSGFDPRTPGAITRHSSRVQRVDLGPAAALFDRYVTSLDEAGLDQTSRWPYSFGSFDSGLPIPLLARALYRDMGEAVLRFGDPFHTTDPGCYMEWLRAADLADGPGRGLPALWRAVYRSRGDLQQAFPDPAGRDRAGFERWILECGLAEHGIDARLAPPP